VQYPKVFQKLNFEQSNPSKLVKDLFLNIRESELRQLVDSAAYKTIFFTDKQLAD